MSDQSKPPGDGTVVIDGDGGREPWPAAAVFFLIGVPLMAIFVGLASWWGIDHIEDQLEAEAREDFEANGLDPDLFEIDFDYRDGDAWGPLPVGVTELDAEGSVDHRLLNDFDVHQRGTVSDDEPEVDDESVDETEDAPEPVLVGTDVTAELVDGQLVLRGTVASEAHREALLAAAADLVGADNVVDELTVAEGEATDGADARIDALAAALRAAGPDDNLTFRLTDESLDVSGTISAARADALEAAIDGAGVDGSADLDIVPLGSTDVVADFDGETITLTGTVLTERHRTQLIAAATSAAGGRANVIDELEVLGGDALVDGADGRVDDMVAAIRTLSDFPAAQAILTDEGVEVVVPAGDDDPAELADEEQINELQGELDALAAEIRENVVFATGSDVLDAGATATLDKVVDAMTRHPLPVVEVSGHTDNVGDPGANATLSGQRAQSVVDYLVSQGIDAARLQSIGVGEAEPIADNDTEEGRAQNRRVELTSLAEFVG